MKQTLGSRYAVIILGIALLSFLVMDFNNRMADMRRLTDQEEVLSGRLMAHTATYAALVTEIAKLESDSAVEEYAYQDGRMRRPGDIPVILIPAAGATPMPSPVPIVEEPEPENWQKWLALLFGPEMLAR